jgi:hypothetical protein
MKEYKAFFVNNHFKAEAKIVLFDDVTENYMMPMFINGIKIETNGFDMLTVLKSENYSKEQLKLFDYEISRYGDYILKNFNLKTIIPVNIIEKNSGNKNSEKIIIEIENYDEVVKKLRLFDTEIFIINDCTELDCLVGAFEELYDKIKNDYTIEICVFCKNSGYNPCSGGVEYYNHVCYKEFTENYSKLDNKDKLNIEPLVTKKALVCLTDSCNKFVE